MPALPHRLTGLHPAPPPFADVLTEEGTPTRGGWGVTHTRVCLPASPPLRPFPAAEEGEGGGLTGGAAAHAHARPPLARPPAGARRADAVMIVQKQHGPEPEGSGPAAGVRSQGVATLRLLQRRYWGADGVATSCDLKSADLGLFRGDGKLVGREVSCPTEGLFSNRLDKEAALHIWG